MRILFLVSRDDTNPQAAGGDIQDSAYARYLAEAGHEVTYLTSFYPGAAARETRAGVRIVRLGRPETLALRMWAYYRRWGDGFDAVFAEAFGGARVPFLAPLYVRQPLLAYWYQVNRPLFVHQYGRAVGSILTRLERWVARLHRRATIITPSEARRADLIELGFRPQQVFAVPPLALDEAAFDSSPDIRQREPLIVWLGKLRRYKCVHHAVEAMPRVLRQCPQARLVIAGRRDDAAYERELRRRIEALGLGSSVSFRFDLSEAAKFDLLRRARLLVLPSPVEGFGIVALEANACGTPAVASEGVPPEVVADGHNGLRVPFADPEALAEAMARALTSPRLLAALSTNGVEHARSFSKARVLTKLNEVLSIAVAAGPRVEVVTA